MSTALPSMMPLGTLMPNFLLQDVITGQWYSSEDLRGRYGTVIMFLCVHCPYVKSVESTIADISKKYIPKGIDFLAISSNDIVAYPQDSPDNMKAQALNCHFSFPYLFDRSQDTAMAFQATCTPDFFFFDDQKKCIYRGRLDKSTPSNYVPTTGKDLIGAIENLLTGNEPIRDQYPSIGCSIKWKN